MGSGASVLGQRFDRHPRAYIFVPARAWICYTVWTVPEEVPYGSDYLPVWDREAQLHPEPSEIVHIRVWLCNKIGYRWLRVGGVRYDPMLHVDGFWE